MKSFLSIVITLKFKSKTLIPFISDPCPSSELCLHLILSQAHGWNTKRGLPVGSSFCSVTRKQLLSQLAVYACRIPGCQKCSWRTNRQPVSSSSSSKSCQNHRCIRTHPSIKLFTFLFQSSIWQLRLILVLAAETIYFSGFKSYRWC